jgi:hypothetical protein
MKKTFAVFLVDLAFLKASFDLTDSRRLWLVVSALWGIAVVAALIGFDGFQTSKHYYYSPSTDELSLGEADEFRKGRDFTVELAHGISVTYASLTARGKPALLLRAMEGPGRDRDIGLTELSDAQAPAQVVAIAGRAASLHQQQLIRSATIWICALSGPPMALLLIGLAVRRMPKGFQRGGYSMTS